MLVAHILKYPASNLLVVRLAVRFNLTHKSQSISHLKIFLQFHFNMINFRQNPIYLSKAGELTEDKAFQVSRDLVLSLEEALPEGPA